MPLNRVRFHGRNNMLYGRGMDKIETIIIPEFKDVTINDAIEFFNIKQYFDDGVRAKDWTDERMNKPYTNTNELPYTLSVEEMAAFLGISRVGAYNLSHSRGFPSKRIGKRILIPRDAFLAWLKELPEVSNG